MHTDGEFQEALKLLAAIADAYEWLDGFEYGDGSPRPTSKTGEARAFLERHGIASPAWHK